MEPNDINPKPENKPQDAKPTPADDLHAEGIDIVGTSMALDNEFSQPESANQTAPSYETEPPQAQNNVAPAMPAPEKPKLSDTIVFSKLPVMDDGPKPQPEEKKQPLQNDPSIKPIRTFKSDAEEAVRYSNVSKMDMVLAEQKKKLASTPVVYDEEKHSSPILYIVLVLVVIAVLVGGWYFWFSSTQSQIPAGKTAGPKATPKAIVAYSLGDTALLDGSTDPFAIIAAKLVNTNAGVGKITAIAPITSQNATATAPIETVLGATHAPNRLVRSLGANYMIGAYSFDVFGPFLILKNTFFQNAYAGMLDWEKDMGSDFLPLIALSYPGERQGSFNPSFEDSVISNIDARILKDASGRTVLAYAFPDKDTIVITTDLNTLKYLLDRILQVRTIQ